jgi:hypothetical protein
VHASVLEMKILIYWSESNSIIYFYILLNKNWKIYWSKQSFTGLGPENWCSLWGLMHHRIMVQVNYTPSAIQEIISTCSLLIWRLKTQWAHDQRLHNWYLSLLCWAFRLGIGIMVLLVVKYLYSGWLSFRV